MMPRRDARPDAGAHALRSWFRRAVWHCRRKKGPGFPSSQAAAALRTRMAHLRPRMVHVSCRSCGTSPYLRATRRRRGRFLPAPPNGPINAVIASPDLYILPPVCGATERSAQAGDYYHPCRQQDPARRLGRHELKLQAVAVPDFQPVRALPDMGQIQGREVADAAVR